MRRNDISDFISVYFREQQKKELFLLRPPLAVAEIDYAFVLGRVQRLQFSARSILRMQSASHLNVH